MVCVQCGGKTQIINSRLQKRSNQVWRRRQCRSCGTVFTTQEAVDYSNVWGVRGSGGRLEPFSRDKLLLSLYKSCQHRPKALEDAAGLTDTVIRRLNAHVNHGSLTKKSITEVVQVALNRFDSAASAHYRAFHTGR